MLDIAHLRVSVIAIILMVIYGCNAAREEKHGNQVSAKCTDKYASSRLPDKEHREEQFIFLIYKKYCKLLLRKANLNNDAKAIRGAIELEGKIDLARTLHLLDSDETNSYKLAIDRGRLIVEEWNNYISNNFIGNHDSFEDYSIVAYMYFYNEAISSDDPGEYRRILNAMMDYRGGKIFISTVKPYVGMIEFKYDKFERNKNNLHRN